MSTRSAATRSHSESVRGTGKTFLAVALAAAALTRREVSRIILTRPAVEAGERLGFLPGDRDGKVDLPAPLFDALRDMIDPEKVSQYLDRGVIEVAPLAFMRGRTLNDSFVILDEAQNTSPEQMKMFLTRLGFGSRMVVTATSPRSIFRVSSSRASSSSARSSRTSRGSSSFDSAARTSFATSSCSGSSRPTPSTASGSHRSYGPGARPPSTCVAGRSDGAGGAGGPEGRRGCISSCAAGPGQRAAGRRDRPALRTRRCGRGVTDGTSRSRL